MIKLLLNYYFIFCKFWSRGFVLTVSRACLKQHTIHIWFPGCVQGQKCFTASQQKSTDETALEEMDFDIQATDDSACTVHIHPVDNNALSTV